MMNPEWVPYIVCGVIVLGAIKLFGQRKVQAAQPTQSQAPAPTVAQAVAKAVDSVMPLPPKDLVQSAVDLKLPAHVLGAMFHKAARDQAMDNLAKAETDKLVKALEGMYQSPFSSPLSQPSAGTSSASPTQPQDAASK